MSGMMGQRILRREDARFLRGKGHYVENLELAGCAPRDVRPLAVRARAHRRASTPRRRRELPGIAGLHRRGRRPRHVPAAADPGPRPADGPAVPRRRRRPLRGRHRRGRPHRDAAPRASTPPSSSSSTTTRCPSWSTPSAALAGDVLLFPEVGHERLREPPGRSATRRCSTAATSSSRAPRQPAAGGVPARAARVRGRRRRRRAADALALDADAAPGPRRPRGAPRPGARRGARRRAGRRRRLRREGPRRRGRSSCPGSRARPGRPVRWTETRSENMVAMDHGRAARARVHDRRQPRRATSRRTACASCRTRAPTRASARSSPASRR